jgi:hypothetical protein
MPATCKHGPTRNRAACWQISLRRDYNNVGSLPTEKTMHGAQLSPSLAGSIAFDEWRGRIDAAPDVEHLVGLVRAYLHAWPPEQLRRLPYDLAATALADSDDIISRALLASLAELKGGGSLAEHAVLREMALTLAAAATRLRLLRSAPPRVGLRGDDR